MPDGVQRCEVCGEPLARLSWGHERRMRHIRKHYQIHHPHRWVESQINNNKKVIRLREIDIATLISIYSSIPMAAEVFLLFWHLIGG